MPPKKTSSPARASGSSWKAFSSRSVLLLAALAILVILVIVVRCYRKKEKKVSPMKPRNGCGMEHESMYFFFAHWCPHCKKAMPEMQDFEAYAKKTFPGKKIHRISTEDPVGTDSSIIACLNVRSVPTVFFVGKTGHFEKMNVACTFPNLKEMAHKVWA